MTVSESAVYSAAFPAVRSAWVTLTLADGRIQSAETTASEGATGSPLTDPEVTEKFRRFAHPVLGVARSDRIEAAVAARAADGPARSLLEDVLTVP